MIGYFDRGPYFLWHNQWAERDVWKCCAAVTASSDLWFGRVQLRKHLLTKINKCSRKSHPFMRRQFHPFMRRQFHPFMRRQFHATGFLSCMGRLLMMNWHWTGGKKNVVMPPKWGYEIVPVLRLCCLSSGWNLVSLTFQLGESTGAFGVPIFPIYINIYSLFNGETRSK